MNLKSKKNQNIGILTFPLSKSGIIPTSNLLKILSALSPKLYLVTGNEATLNYRSDRNINTYFISHKKCENKVKRILNYIYTQLRIAFVLTRVFKNVGIWIFFIGGDTLVLPMLAAKLFRQKVVLVFAGSAINTLIAADDNLSIFAEILSEINRKLSDHIIMYSKNLVIEWNLEKHNKKIIIAHRHFIDFNKFKIIKKWDYRASSIGFVGRLSEEKGIIEFIRSIKLVIADNPDLNFRIIGDGNLKSQIMSYIVDNNLDSKVELIGWVNHEDLPRYLNELKLIVVPSYTEGLPNIMLEAMACGTPVLATSVGAIPDVISDEITGFLLEDNSSISIARNISRVLSYVEIDNLIDNAHNLVNKEYNFENNLETWKIILNNINQD